MHHYKNDFPIFKKTSYGNPFVYLDSSNTTQKPYDVIDAVSQFYKEENANIHRGIYELSERATVAFESVRQKIQTFINAKHAHEIIFTSGTTAAINLIAQSYGKLLSAGDEIIISEMEHHSNIVPWQLLRDQIGIQIKIIPTSDAGEINLIAYEQCFSSRTKLVSITHASNVLGTINPIHEMISIAHANQVPVLVDGAQAFSHLPVDVQALDCDFYVFSAHKAYGPTGVGILYGKTKWLEKMPPYQGGGAMIEQVTFDKTTYAPLPAKFEAGTANIANVIGFGAALDYLQEIGMENIHVHETTLLQDATKRLSHIAGIKIIGTSLSKVGVISFVINGMHPHDMGTILDRQGIAVRVGHHCAMPLMQRFNVPATIRVSFGIYNNTDDIDSLVTGINNAMDFMCINK
ncbi:MAG: cysteine desulfurase [Gammaproteobacteria bacterium]|nr:cysteine desulfurase [Gammaproteobacteria bacterium]